MSCKIKESRYCGSKPTTKLHRDQDPYSRDEVDAVAKKCGLKLSTDGQRKTMSTLCGQLRSCSRGYSCPRRKQSRSRRASKPRSRSARTRRASVPRRRPAVVAAAPYWGGFVDTGTQTSGPFGAMVDAVAQANLSAGSSSQPPPNEVNAAIAAQGRAIAAAQGMPTPSAPPLPNERYFIEEAQRIQAKREQRLRNNNPFYDTNNDLFVNAQNRMQANRKGDVRRERKALREALQAGNPYNAANNNVFYDAEEPGFWNRYFPNVRF